MRVSHPWPSHARFHDETRLSCPCWVMPQQPPSTGSKKVVIIGFGWTAVASGSCIGCKSFIDSTASVCENSPTEITGSSLKCLVTEERRLM